MNLSKFLFYSLVFLISSTGIAGAAQIKLTTYYPSPTGNYNDLTANYVSIGPSAPVPSTATGLLFVSDLVTQNSSVYPYFGTNTTAKPSVQWAVSLGMNYSGGAGEADIWNDASGFTGGFQFMGQNGGGAIDLLNILHNGNVGIGTGAVTPTSQLVVYNNKAGTLYVDTNLDPTFLPGSSLGTIWGTDTTGANGTSIGWNRSGWARETDFTNVIPGYGYPNAASSTEGGFTFNTWNGTTIYNWARIGPQGGMSFKGNASWPYLINAGAEYTNYGSSPEILANGDNHYGGGIAVSDDGGFFDYNDFWITYNGSTGLLISGNAGQGITTGAGTFIAANMGHSGIPYYGGSPHLVANGDNHYGGGIAVSDDGGFYDYNDGWITYNGSTGLKIAGNNGAASTGNDLYVTGNVGIGVGASAPAVPLQVNDAGDVSYLLINTTSAANKRVRLQYGYNGAISWELGTDAWVNNSDNIYFYDRLTSTFGPVILSNGYVGMGGQTSPTQVLDVTGNIHATGTITADSDMRLKQDILPLTGVLSKLDQLHGVSFEWNHLSTTRGHKEGEKSIGMIAQELQKVYPELVVAAKSGHEDYLSIDYIKFTAVLLQSIKELKAQVNALQDQVKVLQEKQKSTK